MKQLISLVIIAIMVISVSCAYGEEAFNLGSLRDFTAKLVYAHRIMADGIEAGIVQNGPNTIAFNLAEVSGNNSFSAFFR